MVHRLTIEERADHQVSVSFRRSGQEDPEAAGEPLAFDVPVTPEDREDLRWYLEDYLLAPYAVYEERGQQVSGQLQEWGKALFATVFGPGTPGHAAYLKAREAETELVLSSRSPAFLSLPWELLQDPERATPLALDLKAIDRTLIVGGASNSVPPGTVLRVLMVVARPAGLYDVGYQMVARPLVERLAAVRGRVDLDVLRPPTLEAFRQILAAAADRGEPYHIVHFDGHGTFGTPAGARSGQTHFEGGAAQCGYLAFEAEGGGEDLVAADRFALVVGQAKVPLVVLNACRSGMLDQGRAEAAVEAAVATRLLESGAASVVAMGYSVYAVAAAEFMAAFYEGLFAGRSVSEAVSLGRHRLHQRRERPSPRGPLPLEDWIVPVHYRRSTIRFPQLKHEPAQDRPSLDALLDRLAPGGPAGPVKGPAAAVPDALMPIGRFVGRDAAFYALELALQWQRVVVVHGTAGTGKTELAKAFARWWLDTGGVEGPTDVVFYSFEPGLASFGLDGVVTAIGLQVFGPDFIARTRDAAHRNAVILALLRERRLLLIWDNVESVYSLPDPNGASPPLEPDERACMRSFLEAVAHEGRSGVILTSRTPEQWLGECRRIGLGGLQPAEAAAMAEDVLRPYPRGRLRRGERAYADLLNWLDGHPLSLRLLLPHLETMSADALLAALKGGASALPPGFVAADEGRLASLGASLAYSLAHVGSDSQGCLPALSLFEGVVDAQVLGAFSQVKGVPARFAKVSLEIWSGLLSRLAGIGVLTELGGGMYGLHPALPAYLGAAWRQAVGAEFAAEQAAAERGLLAAYAGFGQWLQGQITGGEAGFALAVLERQRRTMGRLLGLALTQEHFTEAQFLLQALNGFCQARGLTQEMRGWVDRVRTATESRDGAPPDQNSPAWHLWMFVAVRGAELALTSGDLDRAEEAYEAIRQHLEATNGSSRDRYLSVAYHQLGMVTLKRGDFAAAEGWYRRSLEIDEALGDRPRLAASYHEIGLVAQRRGNLTAAEGWYRRSLEIDEALGDRSGLAATYHQLGRVAQQRYDLAAAEAWYRRSLEIREALGDRPGLAASYHQLGILAQDRGDFAVSEDWYRRSLEIFEALDDRPGLVLSYYQLGNVAQDRGDLALAEAWYRRSLAIEEALGGGPGLATTYRQLGIVAQQRSDLSAAEEWFRKAKEARE